MKKLTGWYHGAKKPARIGYYIVKHAKGDWLSDCGVARFDGMKWERPLGWPSPQDGHGFCVECAENKGYIFDPGCRVFKDVEPTEWRGLASEP